MLSAIHDQVRAIAEKCLGRPLADAEVARLSQLDTSCALIIERLQGHSTDGAVSIHTISDWLRGIVDDVSNAFDRETADRVKALCDEVNAVSYTQISKVYCEWVGAAVGKVLA